MFYLRSGASLLASHLPPTIRRFSSHSLACKQYLVIAKDFIDAEAISRRLAIREAHLDRCRELYKQNKVVAVGALRSDDSDYGKMMGSCHIYEANDVEEVKRIISQDPYIDARVWEDVKIIPLKLVNLSVDAQ
ncbi:hypothetical protein K493DRAFT_333762 [Basidiobolus meristosporus CBS 931.73]|uniref:YCII-related domain-containing protein n=1 Tax=Basidiobolus meristosporus CBS 931.73 TaxID=1314790 RepID=A0A1Y1Z3E0_9FUNG|nr:hypothetical protein K493DRAFT_333762 [Basidiobolus meristosporus CBS 931.73]|eukprot:ORY04801.1 hypothetical protein K493DRAFT_333762 [Basidiobolus meristosporus CBS 931.73]